MTARSRLPDKYAAAIGHVVARGTLLGALSTVVLQAYTLTGGGRAALDPMEVLGLGVVLAVAGVLVVAVHRGLTRWLTRKTAWTGWRRVARPVAASAVAVPVVTGIGVLLDADTELAVFIAGIAVGDHVVSWTRARLATAPRRRTTTAAALVVVLVTASFVAAPVHHAVTPGVDDGGFTTDHAAAAEATGPAAVAKFDDGRFGPFAMHLNGTYRPHYQQGSPARLLAEPENLSGLRDTVTTSYSPAKVRINPTGFAVYHIKQTTRNATRTVEGHYRLETPAGWDDHLVLLSQDYLVQPQAGVNNTETSPGPYELEMENTASMYVVFDVVTPDGHVERIILYLERTEGETA